MRIISFSEFMTLPSETVFMKYRRCIFGTLLVKKSNPGDYNNTDFNYDSITDTLDEGSGMECLDLLFKAEKDSSISLDLDFDGTGRDGLFNKDQLFAVYERKDLEGLIVKLNYCLKMGYK